MVLGRSWAVSRCSWAGLGAVVGSPERPWGAGVDFESDQGAHMARSWGLLGRSWAVIGGVGGPKEHFMKKCFWLERGHKFGGLGGSWGPLVRLLGVLGGSLKVSWG